MDTDEDADKAVETVSEKIKSLKQELIDQKAEADAEEKKMQTFVDESRDDLVSWNIVTLYEVNYDHYELQRRGFVRILFFFNSFLGRDMRMFVLGLFVCSMAFPIHMKF